MKKVRCEKRYGIWYYEALTKKDDVFLDGPVYMLYDNDKNFVSSFICYSDMKYYIETGIQAY